MREWNDRISQEFGDILHHSYQGVNAFGSNHAYFYYLDCIMNSRAHIYTEPDQSLVRGDLVITDDTYSIFDGSDLIPIHEDIPDNFRMFEFGPQHFVIAGYNRLTFNPADIGIVFAASQVLTYGNIDYVMFVYHFIPYIIGIAPRKRFHVDMLNQTVYLTVFRGSPLFDKEFYTYVKLEYNIISLNIFRF